MGQETAGRPFGEAIHATAVEIGGGCLLILGPSGAGKSRLAAALIAASRPRGRIRLVGDDRILLSRRDGILRARPHPRIAGFLERRGLGIVAHPFVEDIAVEGIVRLEKAAADAGRTTAPVAIGQNFPGLPSVIVDNGRFLETQRDIVLAWWRDARTTPAAKATTDPGRTAEV